MTQTPYEELVGYADQLTWPTAEEFDKWAKGNPKDFGVLARYARSAISVLRKNGLIEDETTED